MKSTWNKLGVWALIGVTGLGLLNACGDGEEKDATATAEQLADLKEGEDIWTILGRSNGNRICGKNKSQIECQQGKNSGGKRFEGGISFSGGRSGCEWRGENAKKCRVACDRITSKSLCVGGLITTKSEGCNWQQEGDEQGKCMNPFVAAGNSLIDSGNQAVRGASVYGTSSLSIEDNKCIKSKFSGDKKENTCKLTPGCIWRGKSGDKKCRTSCDRIKNKDVCENHAHGCDWIGGSCS